MRRRDLIKVVAASAAAWPLTARAQQAEQMRRLGILTAVDKNDPEGQRRIAAFVQGLRELGWTEGTNIHIDYRWAGADTRHVRDAAAELVEIKPEVIFAESALTVAPLQQLTNTIPIVFCQIADPVGSGFVASLARPGANITGFTPAEFSIYGKMLEVLKELAPQISHIGVIYNPAQAPQFGMLRAIETTAPSLGVQVIRASASNPDEITHFIERFASEPDGGMIVLPNAVTTLNRSLIIALSARYHLPAAYSFAVFVRDGGLVSYGIDPAEQFHQAAFYVDRILKGAKPGDLPVQQPMKFYLTINLKTAKALGLTISRDFLLVADEVIE